MSTAELPTPSLGWRPVLIWLGTLAHVAACVALLVVGPGTEIGGSAAERMEFVAQNGTLWTIAWRVWTVASASFLAFAIAWSAKIWEKSDEASDRWLSVAACVVALVAVICDLMGESTLIHLLPAAKNPTEFMAVYRTYQWFSPVVANGLYGIVGLILSAISWRQGWLTGIAGAWGFAIWGVALALTVAAIVDSTFWMTATGAATMVLFVPWSAWVGAKTMND